MSPAAGPLHRQVWRERKKRLGDKSFLSDVISWQFSLTSPALSEPTSLPTPAVTPPPLLSSTTS